MKPNTISAAVMAALVFPASGLFAAEQLGYLDDVNPSARHGVSADAFPKVMLTESYQGATGTAEQYSKYDLVGWKGYSLPQVREIQKINLDVGFHFMLSPRAYQGYTQPDPCWQSAGIPFNFTGPASQGCTMFAGH
ncbi:MAG: hypothetical protein K9L70_13900, partial [Thiohalocapsa sp.]|nr:hypothetical protein [Thiohalocapsa sp.]